LAADLPSARMGGREAAAPVPLHAGGAPDLSADSERDPARLLGLLRAAAGSSRQGHGLDRRSSRRGGIRPPVRDGCRGLPEDDDRSRVRTMIGYESWAIDWPRGWRAGDAGAGMIPIEREHAAVVGSGREQWRP